MAGITENVACSIRCRIAFAHAPLCGQTKKVQGNGSQGTHKHTTHTNSIMVRTSDPLSFNRDSVERDTDVQAALHKMMITKHHIRSMPYILRSCQFILASQRASAPCSRSQTHTHQHIPATFCMGGTSTTSLNRLSSLPFAAPERYGIRIETNAK